MGSRVLFNEYGDGHTELQLEIETCNTYILKPSVYYPVTYIEDCKESDGRISKFKITQTELDVTDIKKILDFTKRLVECKSKHKEIEAKRREIASKNLFLTL